MRADATIAPITMQLSTLEAALLIGPEPPVAASNQIETKEVPFYVRSSRSERQHRPCRS
jgi:hypothetical protein